VPPEITAEALEALAMSSDVVQKALEGKSVKNVIVRAPKLVNIATS
jgi:leucyl-tRNA synthetase